MSYVKGICISKCWKKGYSGLSGWEDFLEEFSAQLSPEGREELGKDGSRKKFPGKGESMLRITHRRIKVAHQANSKYFSIWTASVLGVRERETEKTIMRMAKWQGTRKGEGHQGPSDFCWVFQALHRAEGRATGVSEGEGWHNQMWIS